MNWRVMSYVLGPLLLLLNFGCGTTRPTQDIQKQEEVATPLGMEGMHYTTVVFNEGKSSLRDLNRNNLSNLVKKAQNQKAPIREIRILSWADVEYPDKVRGKSSLQDITLAKKRAENIKKFLQEKLEGANDIDSYNMAKRPDLFSKILRDDEFQVKEALEASGATATELPGGDISYTKASKAIVIIDYEGQ